MRFRLLLLLLLLTLLPLGCAVADTVVYEDTTYIFPGEDAPATGSLLTLFVQGLSYDEDMNEVAIPALEGAVFGLYARDAQGGFVPFSDPGNPLVPLQITSAESPVTLALPRSVDLYLRQESAPEGFAVDKKQPEYLPLSLPQAVRIENRRVGVQGLWLTLTGDTDAGAVPLANVPFVLLGSGESYHMAVHLMTDAQGKIALTTIAAGEYTLHQQDAPEGFHIEEEAIPITVTEGEPTVVSIRNGQNATLSLRVLGLALDADKNARLVPIDRAYAVYDADHLYVGEVSPEKPLSLPASRQGTTYTLQAADAPEDGFAEDAQQYTVCLYAGGETTQQAVARYEGGFFALRHVDAQNPSLPVAGGAFALYGEDGALAAEFSANDGGGYALSDPLPAGQYRLQMTRSPQGYLYSGESVPVSIAPYLDSGEATVAAFASEPVPQALYAPEVTAGGQTLPSLFDAEARVDFTLSTFSQALPVTVSDVVYAFALPDVPGLSVLARRNDGASLLLPRRLALEGVQEVSSIAVTGTASYAFSYPADAQGARHEESVQAPFEAVIARFAPSTRTAAYAVSGHVTDAQDAPVQGLRVTLGAQECVTDIFGAYGFDTRILGTEPVFHVADGYGVRRDGADARVLPLRTIAGRVQNHGVAGSPQVALSMGTETAVIPGTDGPFSITGLIAKEDALHAETPKGVLARVEATAEEYVVHLYPAASVSGVVSDPDGTAVANARIVLSGEGTRAETQTDRGGRYAFADLFPGEYAVTASAPQGYVHNGEDARTVTLAAGEALQMPEFSAMQPAAIEGRLLHGETPYADITVTLLPDGAQTTTDENGRFSFSGLSAGSYALQPDLPDDAILLDMPDALVVDRPRQQVSVTLHAVMPASLSGRIWADTNDDGLLAMDEYGLAGAQLALQNRAGETVSTQVTGSDGAFLFGGLTPGDYRVAVTLPDGMIFAREAPGSQRLVAGVNESHAVSEWLVLASGQRLDGMFSGAIVPGAIAGNVWEDANGNGLLDGGELPLSGAVVTLLDGQGQVLAEDTIGEKSAYRFENLRTGAYTLRFDLPEGYVFTMQASAGDGIASTLPAHDTQSAAHAVTLRRGQAQTDVHVGAQRTGTVADTVWLDQEATGVNHGANGLPGATVALVRMVGSAQTEVAHRQTDAGGSVLFENVRPGQYKLRYTLPEGAAWQFTAGLPSGGMEAGESALFVLQNGQNVQAGAVGATKLGGISGLVFVDADYSGLREEGETGLAAHVALLSSGGQVLQEVETGADGAFAFTGVQAGRYAVRFTLPEGYAFTLNRLDAPSFNSDVPETDASEAQTDTLYLPMGEALLVDAGVYQRASIAGTVWQDMAATGLYNAQNPPVSGVAVHLVSAEGERRAQAVTDAQGAYRFAGLAPGQYAVHLVLPEGALLSPLADGARGNAFMAEGNEMAQTALITLRSGDAVADKDAGMVYTGGVGGRVENRKTGGGLSGVGVRLVRAERTIAQTETDANGIYRIDGLYPGAVELRFETPEGWTAAPGESTVWAVDIPQRGMAQDVNLPCIPEASLSGDVWLDANANGGWEAQEAPLLGVEVTLFLLDGEEWTQLSSGQSDIDGRYAFDKLLPGRYRLSMAFPDGILPYNGDEIEPFVLEMGETLHHGVPAYIGSSAEGMVWEDLNNDGMRAVGEPLMAGIPVALCTAEGRVLWETETGEDGRYRIEGIPPMGCAIRFALPEGYLFTAPAEGGSVVPLTDARVGQTETFVLQMGDHLTDINAGALRNTRIGDLVWLDENGNGLQDTGEPGIAGIEVRLWRVLPDGGEEFAAETRTDANGRYRFDPVRPGAYRVAFEIGDAYVPDPLHPGEYRLMLEASTAYLPTKPVPGLEQINSKLPWNARPILTTEVFTALSGLHNLTLDAGLVTPAMAEAFGWTIDENAVIAE